MSTASDHELIESVRREIDQEVARLRASGAFPPSFEQRLEDLFAQVVPAGVVERETAEALRHLESLSHLDIEVPTASNIPGGRPVKQVLRRLMAWYLEYLAAQLNRFMASTVRVLRLMEERVAALEAAAPAAESHGGPGGPGVDLDGWAEVVVERLKGSDPLMGPVLHAECGPGVLLARLAAAGIDAYGVDPRADLLDQAVLAVGSAAVPAVAGEEPLVPVAPVGLDARWVDPLDHLRSLDDASLAGLVLSGCVDRFEVGAQRELAGLAATKVAPGGVVLVIGTTPSAWLARRIGVEEEGTVEADLAPGRPLHPRTWAWLLGSEGMGNVEVLAPSRAEAAGPTPGSPGASPPTGGPPGGDLADVGDDLTRFAALLRGPSSFAVVATRPAARHWH